MYSPFTITQRKDMFFYGPMSRWHVISTLLISVVYLIKLSSAEGMVHLCIFNNVTHTETRARTHTLQIYMGIRLFTQPLFEELSLNHTSGKQKSQAPCVWTLQKSIKGWWHCEKLTHLKMQTSLQESPMHTYVPFIYRTGTQRFKGQVPFLSEFNTIVPLVSLRNAAQWWVHDKYYESVNVVLMSFFFL